MAKYYTLISKGLEDYHNGEWCIEFGAYDRETVSDEMDDRKATAEHMQERIKFKIIATEDNQTSISEAVAKLNS